MGVLSISLSFVGYLLVYAAVANHGQFAKEPWLGVVGDAYDPNGAKGLGDTSGLDGKLGASDTLPSRVRGAIRGTDTAGNSPTAA